MHVNKALVKTPSNYTLKKCRVKKITQP